MNHEHLSASLRGEAISDRRNMSIATIVARRALLALTALLTTAALLAPGAVATAQEDPSWQKLGPAAPHATNSPAVTASDAGTIIVTTQDDQSIAWTLAGGNAFIPIPGGWRTEDAPAVAVLGSETWVFIRGLDHSLWYNRLPDVHEGRWMGWRLIPNSRSMGTPSVVTRDDRVLLFYTDEQHHMRWSLYRTQAPTGWTRTNEAVGGNGTTESSPAATVFGIDRNHIALFHRGTDDRLYRQDAGIDDNGLSWSNQWSRQGETRIAGRPSAASAGALLDTIVVTARGAVSTQDVLLQTIEIGHPAPGWRPAYGWNPTDWAPIVYTTLAATIHVVALRFDQNRIYGKRAY